MIRAKKSLGQHFLSDRNILQKILREGHVTSDLPVLEIGPGPGGLTRELLQLGCRVTAVELDREAVAHLKTEFFQEIAKGQFHLIHGDILQDWKLFLTGTERWQIIGNIPYNISTEILFKAVESRARCQHAIFMVQKEVAERVVAISGGDYGILSIGMQLASHPKRLFSVGRKSFHPPPKVDSAVLRLDFSNPTYPDGVYAPTLTLVKCAFQQRRKTMRNALLRAGWEPSIIDARLAKLGIPPNARPEDLTPKQWVILAENQTMS